MDQGLAAISRGALRRIFNGTISESEHPIVQVLQVKSIEAQGNAPERHRVVLSDSENFVQSMIATQSNHLVSSGKLKKGVLVRMIQYQPSTLKARRIMVLLNFEVLEEHGELDKLGKPEPLETEGTSALADAPAAVAPSNFYGNKPTAPPAPRPAPTYGGAQSNAPVHSSKHGTIYPIEGLSPYQNKWTIRARVVNKSDIKTWKNPKSEGKLFSVNLLDDSGEIKATGFSEQCNEFYDVLQEGKVYYISKCNVVNANRRFSTLRHDYELTFQRDTTIEECTDESSVPQVKFNFVPISQLTTIEPNSTVDVLGVLKDVGELSNLISKNTNKPYSKRDLTICDSSGYLVKLTVWGNQAASFDTPLETVVAFKGVKVSDFGGRSLGTVMGTQVLPNPDIEEAHKLKGWWQGKGRGERFDTHYSSSGSAGGREERYLNLQQIKDENIGMNEKPDYFTAKATISYIKNENAFYPACQTTHEDGKTCNKKVLETSSGGGWRCEACDKEWPQPRYRYILTLICYDAFNSVILNGFDDTGKMIMGMDADALQRLQATDMDAYTQAFLTAACKTYEFKCRAKMETYNDQQRVRYNVMSATPVDFVKAAHKLIEQIKLYD